MRWGIVDVTDGTWIGNDQGPITFDENDFATPEMALGVARVSSQTLETQVYGTDMGCKYQVREFPEERMRKKEDIPVRMSSLQALQRLEGGGEVQ
jgi:hypothetical protein